MHRRRSNEPHIRRLPRFEAKKIALLEDIDINPRKFDTMMELIAESTGTVAIDSGSSSYNSLSVTCYPFLDHSAGRYSASLSCYPFLDHSAGGHPASAGSGGPCAADRFTSDIGVLLPIALCGRTSL